VKWIWEGDIVSLGELVAKWADAEPSRCWRDDTSELDLYRFAEVREGVLLVNGDLLAEELYTLRQALDKTMIGYVLDFGWQYMPQAQKWKVSFLSRTRETDCPELTMLEYYLEWLSRQEVFEE